jgi:ketosteroid isomerase-like protein
VRAAFPGGHATLYSGFDGLRDCWLDWLAPWTSYRVEVEKLIDVGERVVTLTRDYGRREPGAPEVGQDSAAIWTVRGGRIVRAEFYADRAEGLASIAPAERKPRRGR